MCGILNYLAWVVVISFVAEFLLSLLVKWGWLEWLQVHAPNDFFYKLLTCKFCTSFWTCVIISLFLSLVTGQWLIMAVPLCSTIIVRDRW